MTAVRRSRSKKTQVAPEPVLEFASSEERIEHQYRVRATSPLKAIRAFCVLCMGCQPKKVTACEATDCTLYPFRQGRNPYQKHLKKKASEPIK